MDELPAPDFRGCLEGLRARELGGAGWVVHLAVFRNRGYSGWRFQSL